MNSIPYGKSSMRRGYALVTVSVFLVLILTMVGITQCHLASVLRVEQARVQAQHRDEGLIHGLSKALELIETGQPPSDPYVCATTIDTSQGLESFTVTYAKETAKIWIVRVTPTSPDENPPPMPASFAE